MQARDVEGSKMPKARQEALVLDMAPLNLTTIKVAIRLWVGPKKSAVQPRGGVLEQKTYFIPKCNVRLWSDRGQIKICGVTEGWSFGQGQSLDKGRGTL